MRLVLFVLVSFPALAGGRLPSVDRSAEQRAEQRWRAQGKKAIPALVKASCGDNGHGNVDIAVRVLADYGADAAGAVIAYRGKCTHIDGDVVVGQPRHETLASIYCAMVGPYEEAKRADVAALARWGRAIVDDDVLAVDTLHEVVVRDCHESLYEPLLPALLEASRFAHVGGRTVRTKRDEVVVHALAASKGTRAIEQLGYLYDNGDLRTRLSVIEAVDRAGPAAQVLQPRALDFLARTRDDEARVRSLRALASMHAKLGGADADAVAAVVDELLPRVVDQSRTGMLGGLTQDGWALRGSFDGLAVLARGNVERASPAQEALLRSLSTPLVHWVRHAAAQKLAEDAAALWPAEHACVEETLRGPTPSPAELAARAHTNMANAFGDPPSTTPAPSCVR